MIAIVAQTSSASLRLPRAALPVAAALVAAILMQSLWIPVDADVSWLITLCEQVLSGERLYVGLLEANPPASVWLYLPQVWLAQCLAVRPEPVVIGVAMAAALVSIRCTLALSARLPHPPRADWLAAGLALILLVLPGGLFAQREHYALIVALPALAAMALLCDGRKVPARAAALVGFAAGAVVVIKPPFVLVFLLPAAWCLIRTKRLEPLLAPVIAASLMLALYTAALLLFAPEYLDVLPMLQATYLPMRDTPLNFLLGPMLVIPGSLYLLAHMLRTQSLSPLPTVLFFAAAGFALAGLIQGKNYLNHSFPGVALGLLAIWLQLSSRSEDLIMQRVAWAGLVGLTLLHLHATTSVQPPPGLATAMRTTGPPGATVMTLGTELATGHPATRLAGGTWVGSRASLFTAAAARYVGLEDRRVRQWYRDDLDSFVRDVSTAKPDLVLVEDRPRSWLLADPAIAAAMRDYAPAARAGGIEVWRRR